MENIREIVLDALIAMEREQIYSNVLIFQLLDKYDYLEMRDKAFMKRLFEGTVEKRIELDYRIEQYSTVKINKMKPFIRNLMRMSAYQIVYMEGVPDRAAVNEAVGLARGHKFANLSGFVNAILRKLSEGKASFSFPDEKKQPCRYLSVKYSMPEWIVQLWLEAYNKEKTIEILEALNQVSPVSLRFSKKYPEEDVKGLLDEMKAQNIEVEPSELLPYVYRIAGINGVANLPGYEEGAFVVQDASSALAVEAAGIKPLDFVLDACASPGGKSILASEMAKKVLARDVSEEKIQRICENAQRMKCDNIEVEVFDATVLDEALVGKVDVLLLDVPCSGLGILGKKRDIKYRLQKDSLSELYQLQQNIVETCIKYLKEGGTLLYSTCTINPSENEKQVEWMCRELPLRLEGECHQLFPGQSDGFFYAKLIKEV